MNKHSQPQGFTLIELLVVIAIIGLLSAIVLSALAASRTKGIDAAVKSNLTNARAQMELFASYNNNLYVGAPSALGTASDACSATALANGNVKGVYDFLTATVNVLGSGYAVNVFSGSTMKAGKSIWVTCHATPTSGSFAPYNEWAIEAPLKGSYPGFTAPMYCIDSSGNSGITEGTPQTTLAGGDALCNIP